MGRIVVSRDQPMGGGVQQSGQAGAVIAQGLVKRQPGTRRPLSLHAVSGKQGSGKGVEPGDAVGVVAWGGYQPQPAGQRRPILQNPAGPDAAQPGLYRRAVRWKAGADDFGISERVGELRRLRGRGDGDAGGTPLQQPGVAPNVVAVGMGADQIPDVAGTATRFGQGGENHLVHHVRRGAAVDEDAFAPLYENDPGPISPERNLEKIEVLSYAFEDFHSLPPISCPSHTRRPISRPVMVSMPELAPVSASRFHPSACPARASRRVSEIKPSRAQQI